MDESKEQVVGLFSRAAATYDSVGPHHFSYFASRLVEFADVRPGSDVLDVATGTGVVLVAVSERLGGLGSVVGIDLSEAMLERAASEIERRSVPSVELRVMDAEALQFPDSSFDFVLCSFAFLALPYKERALDEFRRVLKPGGRVGLLDAFGWFFQHDSRWLWQERLLRAYGVLDVERGGAEWTHADLEHALRSAGFSAVVGIEDSYELVFGDDEWWRWVWSHGARRLYESVPQARLERLRVELAQGLQRCREADGRIHGTLRASLVRGDKPQPRDVAGSGRPR